MLDLLPPEMLKDDIMFPAAEALAPLEFGAAATLTNPPAPRSWRSSSRPDRAATTRLPVRRIGSLAFTGRARVSLEAANRKAAGSTRWLTAVLIAPSALWFLFLLVLPLCVVVVYSFGERAPTGGYQAAFTFANYLNLPARLAAFKNTLILAPTGTLICLIAGYPLAYYLAVKVKEKNRLLLLILVIVP